MTPTKPLVTIIIPCYNYGRFLSQALASSLGQTYSPIEIMVIDDGSTDNTAEIAAQYKLKGVKYIYKNNGGLSSARNEGMRHAKGKFYIFLDADDIIESDYVAKTMKAFKKARGSSVAYAYTQMRLFGRESSTTDFPNFSLERLKVDNFIHCSALISAKSLEETGVHYDEDLKTGWEDWDLYLSLAEKGYGGVLVNEPLLRYRKHGSGSSMLDELLAEQNQRKLRLRLYRKHYRLFSWRFLIWAHVNHWVLRIQSK